MAHRKPLTFDITEKGCRVCTSHSLNKGGYVRLFVSDSVSPRMQFLHRMVWEEVHGKIPEGFEINHKCKNRACSNIDHLECIPGKDHTILTNVDRYKERRDEVESYWRSTACTAKELSIRFDANVFTCYHWIRKWRKL